MQTLLWIYDAFVVKYILWYKILYKYDVETLNGWLVLEVYLWYYVNSSIQIIVDTETIFKPFTIEKFSNVSSSITKMVHVNNVLLFFFFLKVDIFVYVILPWFLPSLKSMIYYKMKGFSLIFHELIKVSVKC